ncbi:zinc finger, CCHC-type containing protein [Tanacetum coccineum]|uniref:Zinc finger, CCHC-type containing protein n=1 Tax=Tanacetum coccineum TaxID=301880 RepID=A0ABQ5CBR8_9ASTR
MSSVEPNPSWPRNPYANSVDYMECYNSCGSRHGLYYNSCEDDYKLLLITQYANSAYIYSLRSDSWRKLNNNLRFQVAGTHWRPGFCLNKNLYFLSIHIALGSIRFDTTTERFHNIETPPVYDKPNTATFIVHRGSIHFCVKYDTRRTGFLKSSCIDLWKFSLDGDIWNKAVTYQLMPNDDIHCLSPVHLMNNGKWLMISYRYGGGRICQVDLKKKKYTKDKGGRKSKGKTKSKGNCYDEYNCIILTLKWVALNKSDTPRRLCHLISI